MCGPSSEETMAQAQQASLASSLAANFNENFKNQSDILGKLNAMWTPIAAAGPVQTGMGAAELAALTTGGHRRRCSRICQSWTGFTNHLGGSRRRSRVFA